METQKNSERNLPNQIPAIEGDGNIKKDGIACRGGDKEKDNTLVEKYNINDQAHSDSSPDDFVKTISGFRHSGDMNQDTNFNENPGGISSSD